jgi:hypothetical protein
VRVLARVPCLGAIGTGVAEADRVDGEGVIASCGFISITWISESDSDGGSDKGSESVSETTSSSLRTVIVESWSWACLGFRIGLETALALSDLRLLRDIGG